MNDTIRMQLSAFVDDELPENEAELLLRRVCQDDALRQEAAEYLAISRLMRDEAGFAGADRLNERVAAEIEQRPLIDKNLEVASGSARLVRPLAGFAIAASVALLAIFGLQQIDVPGNNDTVAPGGESIADATPQLTEEQRRQFQQNHNRAMSQQGASSINARLATMRFSEDVVEEEVADENTPEDSAAVADESDVVSDDIAQ